MNRERCCVAVSLGLVVAVVTSPALASPIPNDAQLYLDRTLLLPGYAIGGVAWHQGQLWTVDQSGVLRRADPLDGTVLETESTGLITHNNLGSDGSTLYMSYDPGGNTWFKPVRPSGSSMLTPTYGARDMTAQGGALWYSDFDEGKIVKMSTSGVLLAQYPSPFGFGASGIEWDGLHLLHIAHDGHELAFVNPIDGTEEWPRIDVSSIVPGVPGGLAYDGQFLYGAAFDRIYVIGVVPEPASLFALLVGAVFLRNTRRMNRVT